MWNNLKMMLNSLAASFWHGFTEPYRLVVGTALITFALVVVSLDNYFTYEYNKDDDA